MATVHNLLRQGRVLLDCLTDHVRAHLDSDAVPQVVTPSHCKMFYNAAKARVAPSTAESYMFTLRSFFNWCVMENLCRHNPVAQVQLDRIDRKGRTQFADLELA